MFNTALMRHLYQQPAPITGASPVGAPRPMSAPGAVPGAPMGGLFGAGANALRGQQARQNPTLPHFDEDRQRTMDMLNGRSAFAGNEWGGLINQLTGQMTGANSLAQMQYRQASQDTTSQLSSLSRGSASPAAARQAMIQQGRVGQGLASGLAQAGTQERMAASQALTQALSSRDQINSNAYLDILGAQLGLSRAQLEALTGNADRASRDADSKRQAKAAKWGAVAGGAGALAML